MTPNPSFKQDALSAPLNSNVGIANNQKQQLSTQEKPMTKALAHPGKRFQGQFIDGLVAYFLGFVSYYALDNFIGREPAVYSGIAVGVIYFLLSDALPNGQSIGKRLLNIQVVSKVLNCTQI